MVFIVTATNFNKKKNNNIYSKKKLKVIQIRDGYKQRFHVRYCNLENLQIWCDVNPILSFLLYYAAGCCEWGNSVPVYDMSHKIKLTKIKFLGLGVRLLLSDWIGWSYFFSVLDLETLISITLILILSIRSVDLVQIYT